MMLYKKLAICLLVATGLTHNAASVTCPAVTRIVQYKDRSGADLSPPSPILNVSSAGECCSICGITADCMTFAYIAAERTCFVKNDITRLQNLPYKALAPEIDVGVYGWNQRLRCSSIVRRGYQSADVFDPRGPGRQLNPAQPYPLINGRPECGVEFSGITDTLDISTDLKTLTLSSRRTGWGWGFLSEYTTTSFSGFPAKVTGARLVNSTYRFLRSFSNDEFRLYGTYNSVSISYPRTSTVYVTPMVATFEITYEPQL